MHNVYKEALAVSVQRIFNGILSHTEGIMLMPMAVHGGCVHFCQQEDCGCIYSVCMCELHITHAIYINITHVLEMHAQWITRGRPFPWLYPFVAIIIMQCSTVINAPLLTVYCANCSASLNSFNKSNSYLHHTDFHSILQHKCSYLAGSRLLHSGRAECIQLMTRVKETCKIWTIEFSKQIYRQYMLAVCIPLLQW